MLFDLQKGILKQKVVISRSKPPQICLSVVPLQLMNIILYKSIYYNIIITQNDRVMEPNDPNPAF